MPSFVAIDPIGLVAIFIGLATNISREQQRRQGLIGIMTALCIAVGFIFLGELIFNALGITDADFQVAGGLILLGLAARELLNVGPQAPEGSAKSIRSEEHTSELQSRLHLVCRLLLEKKKNSSAVSERRA